MQQQVLILCDYAADGYDNRTAAPARASDGWKARVSESLIS
jgi:hypothetical protein